MRPPWRGSNKHSAARNRNGETTLIGAPQNTHSVLTQDLVDEARHPTIAAGDRVIAFLKVRLAA